MALNVWTKLSGESLGLFEERLPVSYDLPVLNPLDTSITYKVITGKLPAGLTIEQATLTTPARISGVPFEVARITESTFCIRATGSNGISDRTFKMSIGGVDAPEFITPTGALAVGPAQQLFTLDKSYIDYQLEVIDPDLSTGQTLTYYLVSGQLPNGLRLTDTGRIVGYILPTEPIKIEAGAGVYDDGYYDAVFYDFGGGATRSTILNKNYEFIVGVTDGDTIPSSSVKTTGSSIYVTGSISGSILTVTAGQDIVPGMTVAIPSATGFIEGTKIMPFGTASTTGSGGIGTYKLSKQQTITVPSSTFILSDIVYSIEYKSQRKFSIFVVGDDYFRADNTNWLDGSDDYTADVTYLRAPVWVTEPNLGTFRANNYLTVMLDTYDTDFISYDLEYATNIWTPNTAYAVNDLVYFDDTPLSGSTTTRKEYICIKAHTSSGTTPDIAKWADYGLPPGMTFDKVAGEIFGEVPYQPAISKIYRFIAVATRFGTNDDSVSTKRLFYLNLIGEIDSVIKWITPSDLGTINANYVSLQSLVAESSVPSAVLLYTVTSGTLPPGLTLNLDGELVGKVRQYGDDVLYRSTWKANRQYNVNDVVIRNGEYYKAVAPSNSATFQTNNWSSYTFVETGITSIDGTSFTYDNGSTVFDNVFTFTVEASDQYGYSAIERTFKQVVDTPNTLAYSNIRTRPFLAPSQRAKWKDFINNTNIFTPSSIYRPNDPSFGLQTELSMLVYAGIETSSIDDYVSAIGLNHKRKRFQFGAVKSAIAYEPGTNNAIYEVVYVQMIDPLEPDNKKLPSKINAHSYNPKTVTVDNSAAIWERSNISKLNEQFPDLQRPDPLITADSTGYKVSTPNAFEYYVSSISNWRDSIKSSVHADNTQLGSERNYLPLWMRSIQPGFKQELDFQLAVPLCFCKVGTAADILLNIKNSKFDFKVLDYTAERFIIDSVQGSTSDKYLIFRNDRITL